MLTTPQVYKLNINQVFTAYILVNHNIRFWFSLIGPNGSVHVNMAADVSN